MKLFVKITLFAICLIIISCGSFGEAMLATLTTYNPYGYGYGQYTNTNSTIPTTGGNYSSYSGNSSSSSTSSTSSSNTSTQAKTQNTTSSSDGLLYEGLYTISDQGYCAEMGGYTNALGSGQVVNVKIYKDSIFVWGTKCEYLRTSGGWNIYQGTISNFGNEYYKVNLQNFAMSKYCIAYNQFTGGTNTWTYAMAKGETTFAIQSNGNHSSYSGNSSSSSTSSTSSRTTSTSSRKQDCRSIKDNPKYTCGNTGKCGMCNGDGLMDGSFGQGPNSLRCTLCNGTGKCKYCK
ncbi:MAG: hypothetical protein IIV19_01975 [Bacteroidaceae bacterium]|nr:hypothetical protein [Bacteroidaceae bacterium]